MGIRLLVKLQCHIGKGHVEIAKWLKNVYIPLYLVLMYIYNINTLLHNYAYYIMIIDLYNSHDFN